MERFYCTHDLSAVEGFTACTGFFSALVPQLTSPNDIERCFCVTICDGKHAFAEWSDALFQASSVDKGKQRTAHFTADQIYEATLTFCRYYNQIFSSELDRVVSLCQSETSVVRELFKRMLEKAPVRKIAISFDWQQEKSNTLSVEQTYTLCLSFFLDLWPQISEKVGTFGESIFDAHDLFFMNICLHGDTFEEWNEAVFRATNIAKEAQKKAHLNDEEAFSCLIEFCRIFDKQYHGRLEYMINFLKAMDKNPADFQREWTLFCKLKTQIITGCLYSRFKWID